MGAVLKAAPWGVRSGVGPGPVSPRAALAAAFLFVLLAGCAAAPTAPAPAPPEAVEVPPPHEYLPGLRAWSHVPEGVTTAPVVVIIPGGSWLSAVADGLHPLAAELAARGVFAMPATIRVADAGATWPVPVEDVLCAVADGVATARELGIEPGPVVVLGHSAGAHLAAVAALSAQDFDPGCRDELVAPDAVVGLAGPYDIRQYAEPAEALMGRGSDPEQDPRWAAANPVLLAERNPDVSFLLLHGTIDEVVPQAFTTDFAIALDEAGHPTTVAVLDGIDHGEVYWPSVAVDPVMRWLATVMTPATPDPPGPWG
ncbi:alpha/beta hydrolase family protein [Oryzobacter sp. R7]|uniref:alpha/beta hydrolase family protein n=1 Tax=Oryzobacter faecalis TaxID=3388656 RepID=UPI00398CE1C0